MWTDVFSLWGMIIICVVAGAAASAIIEVAKQWRKARVAEAQAVLKLELTKQGRTADEIDQILRAGDTA
jgi:hypothetical protein